MVGPGDELGFLVEDRLGRERTVDHRLGHRAAVVAEQCILGDRRRQVDASRLGGVVDDAVDPADQPVGIDARLGGDRCADLAVELRWAPRRLLLAHRRHCLVHDRPSGRSFDPGRWPALVERVGDHPCRLVPEGSDLFGPLRVEYGRVERVGLGGPGVDRCLSFEPPPFAWRRLAAHGLDEAVELGVDPPADVGGAAGELGEDLVGDIGDLGDAVLGDVPADTEAVGQLAAQTRRGTSPTATAGRA